jgi:thiol-disulfide isomerase/thioredoxin
MIRILILLVALLPLRSTLSAGNITLVAEADCPELETLFLYRFGGLHFDKALQAPVRNGKAVFTLPEAEWSFYYLGADDKDVLPVILGREKEVRVKVICNGVAGSEILNSQIHLEYQALKSLINGYKNQGNQLNKKYYPQLSAGQTPETFVDEMGRLDQRKLQFLEQTLGQNPFFGEIVALNTYLSFFVQPSDHPNELEFFAAEYFRFVKWDAPALAYQPWVFESFKAYASALADTKMPAENLKEYIDRTLARIPASSRTHILALSGVISGVEKSNPEAFVLYADAYIQRYGKTQPREAKSLKDRMGVQGRMMPGAEAPDFVQDDPDGKPVALSSLRGKVLLVDFWASWCGPCRRENPAVRRLYDKYHEKGFDILGVSLDQDRQRWLDAIAKDALIWTQVSDLQGWRNAAGQLYQVSSIPHTVLLDPEGRIIATKLRGAALERKLEEIFGF